MRISTFAEVAVLIGGSLAEIGLSVQSLVSGINGKPVRIVDGVLTVSQTDDGPIFQGFFQEGALVLSPKLVSQQNQGAGIGVTEDGLLTVSHNRSNLFYDHNGWLEYDHQSLFGLSTTDDGSYHFYANRPDLSDAQPALLQLAQLVYPDGNGSAAVSLPDVWGRPDGVPHGDDVQKLDEATNKEVSGDFNIPAIPLQLQTEPGPVLPSWSIPAISVPPIASGSSWIVSELNTISSVLGRTYSPSSLESHTSSLLQKSISSGKGPTAVQTSSDMTDYWRESYYSTYENSIVPTHGPSGTVTSQHRTPFLTGVWLTVHTTRSTHNLLTTVTTSPSSLSTYDLLTTITTPTSTLSTHNLLTTLATSSAKSNSGVNNAWTTAISAKHSTKRALTTSHMIPGTNDVPHPTPHPSTLPSTTFSVDTPLSYVPTIDTKISPTDWAKTVQSETPHKQPRTRTRSRPLVTSPAYRTSVAVDTPLSHPALPSTSISTNYLMTTLFDTEFNQVRTQPSTLSTIYLTTSIPVDDTFGDIATKTPKLTTSYLTAHIPVGTAGSNKNAGMERMKMEDNAEIRELDEPLVLQALNMEPTAKSVNPVESWASTHIRSNDVTKNALAVTTSPEYLAPQTAQHAAAGGSMGYGMELKSGTQKESENESALRLTIQTAPNARMSALMTSGSVVSPCSGDRTAHPATQSGSTIGRSFAFSTFVTTKGPLEATIRGSAAQPSSK